MGLRWLEGFEHARLAAVMQEANVDLASKTLKTGKVLYTHGITGSAYCALHVSCVKVPVSVAACDAHVLWNPSDKRSRHLIL